MRLNVFRSLVDSRNVHTIRRDFVAIAAFIAVIWIVFAFDRFMALEQYGLVPRSGRGLVGIFAMPFLHGDLSHIIGNTIPLAVTQQRGYSFSDHRSWRSWSLGFRS